jgi:dTMP kinase
MTSWHWKPDVVRGALIVFEGLDQSGKETQAQLLRERLREAGRKVRLLSFPDDGTSIGEEIARALQGEREYASDVMQLLFVANRHERREAMLEWLAGGLILLCDRYRASSIAYGEAQGLDPAWLEDLQRFLPQAELTIFIDIAPETAAKRKAHDRDRYERDLALLGRVRASYQRQSAHGDWVRIDGERTKELIADDVFAAVADRLAVSRD